MTTRLLDAIPDLLAPVNAIWGSLDRTTMGTLDERIDALRGERPDVRINVLEGIGHWTQFEGAEEYNELLIRMISQ
tara:strand:- start:236 stop:463 length:228 start_codon:yes stop_codon:yes gene_type:complete